MAREKAKQQQGRAVGSVQVVEDDDERRDGGGVGEKRPETVEEGEALLLRQRLGRGAGDRVAASRRRWPGDDLGEEVLGGIRAGVRRVAAHPRTDYLYPRPIGRCPTVLPAPSPEYRRTAGSRSRGKLRREARLAHSGLAGKQEDAAPAAQRRVEGSVELLELLPPADERLFVTRRIGSGGRGSLGHRRSLGAWSSDLFGRAWLVCQGEVSRW